MKLVQAPYMENIWIKIENTCCIKYIQYDTTQPTQSQFRTEVHSLAGHINTSPHLVYPGDMLVK